MPILIGFVMAATAFRGWLMIQHMKHSLPWMIQEFAKKFANK